MRKLAGDLVPSGCDIRLAYLEGCVVSGLGGDDTEPSQALVARELRRHRERAGMSRTDLAKKVGYSRTYVSTCEKPGADLVSEAAVTRIDKALDAGGALVAVRARVAVALRRRRSTFLSVIDDNSSTRNAASPSDSLLDVLDVLGPADTLAAMTEVTDTVIGRYELEGPGRLFSETQALHRLCRDLGERVSGAAERAHLARVSARQAALLAYMSVNLGEHHRAERYAWGATMLATAVKDSALLAWIKGTQSFCAYYQHRYHDALNLARVGITLAGDDGQRIRLLVNGVARAAGRLGERDVVDRAVASAFEGLDAASPTKMTSCIDLAPYGQARVLANAATAYLSVGEPARALTLVEQLRVTVAESESDWSRALVGLDEATALVLHPDADLAHAAEVGSAALAVSAHNPIASIAGRATELVRHLSSRGSPRAADGISEVLRTFTVAGSDS